MQIKVFTIPVHDDGGWNEELNRFLRSHRVLEVEREFVQDGSASCWCFCVRYLNVNAGTKGASQRRRVDYKDVLDEPTFATFAALRARRKQIAGEDGVPAFAVFTDEQLADMARLETLTAVTMRGVKGVAEGKIARYGDRLLAPANAEGEGT